MTDFFASQDRQQRIALLVILALGSWMLWQTYWGSLLLYPFTILSTWFHEMGHGIAAMLTGNTFDRLLIYPDGSGLALSLRPADSSRFVDALVAAGGPLGPPIAGCSADPRIADTAQDEVGANGHLAQHCFYRR